MYYSSALRSLQSLRPLTTVSVETALRPNNHTLTTSSPAHARWARSSRRSIGRVGVVARRDLSGTARDTAKTALPTTGCTTRQRSSMNTTTMATCTLCSTPPESRCVRQTRKPLPTRGSTAPIRSTSVRCTTTGCCRQSTAFAAVASPAQTLVDFEVKHNVRGNGSYIMWQSLGASQGHLATDVEDLPVVTMETRFGGIRKHRKDIQLRGTT